MYNQPSIPPASYHHHPMANNGIHGNLLEVTVVCCNKLKDKEWISRKDPYVCVEYGSNRFRTHVCSDGGKNSTFQEKFIFSLIEGLRELNVIVWNSNTLSHDDFIGSGKHAGELRLILHYSSGNKPANSYAPSAPPYVSSCTPQVSMYSAPLPPLSTSYPQPALTAPYPPAGAYPAPSSYPSAVELSISLGPAHERRYTSSVKIKVCDVIVGVVGDEKPKVKGAETSTAVAMLCT